MSGDVIGRISGGSSSVRLMDVVSRHLGRISKGGVRLPNGSADRAYHQGDPPVQDLPVPRRKASGSGGQPAIDRRVGRRAVLGSLAAVAVGTPIVIAQPWAGAATHPAAPGAAPQATPTPTLPSPLWSPNPGTDGLKAFEGIEA